MFTQFFGNYLLNNKLISIAQLTEALEHQKYTRLKLGVLAINAGYLTATQVDNIHKAQASSDVRMGDLAVDMGYLTREQVNALLIFQRAGHLLLGQSLIDRGIMSNDDFENALNSYKRDNAITDLDFTNSQHEKIRNVIKEFYQFSNYKNSDLYTDYVSLLFKNIIRFIGDDFTPLASNVIKEYETKWVATQNVLGEFNAFTGVEGDEKAFVAFASRYSQENLLKNDDYAQACMGEFLNLQNGLFTVNMSNSKELELEITPQQVGHGKKLEFNGDAFCIPVHFPFGKIEFILSGNCPVIV